MPAPTVCVIGGGIQGICAALEVARLGGRVTLVDAADAIMSRASLRGEGKVHLGFVYAQDASRETPRLMLDAALHFAPLMERWTGTLDWGAMTSQPFAYATLPDSQLPADQLLAHYTWLDERYRERYRGSGLHYLGATPDTLLPAPSSNGRAAADWPARGAIVADTAERSLHSARLRDRLRAALSAHPHIEVVLGTRVQAIEAAAGGFRISAEAADGGRWERAFASVVNCSWSDRLRLDRHVGIEPDRPWVYRLKYAIRGRLPESHRRPSLTFALGPYGDVVTYPDDQVYVSWYPVCMRGWSHALTPPSAWDPARNAAPSAEERAAVLDGVMDEFGAIVPGLRETAVNYVGAGVIFSWGTRDIDHRSSELHRRDQIGVAGGDGYYTINTGKFTCGPLFADRLGTRMRADGVLA